MPMKTSRHPRALRNQRGSVLIVALIFAAAIAISLASYLRLATTASRISYRSHYAGVAMNAAESGLEQAMWSINKQKAADTAAWTGWDTTSGTTARRTFALGTVSGGGVVTVKVLVSDRNLTTTAPYAIARAIVTPVNGAVVEKWIKISLYQRSYFKNGLVAKDGIVFSGNNVFVDSYNSENGAYTPSSIINRYARGSAGSASVAMDSLSVGNADIYGFVSIGTSNYTGLSVGSQGKVTGDFSAAEGTVDYDRVATNFTANFDPVTAPTDNATYVTINNDVTLPPLTAAASDPNVSTVTDADTGVVTTYYNYRTSNVDLKNSEVLNIRPGYNVVLTVTGSVSVGGNGSIAVNSTKDNSTGVKLEGTLNLYASGDVTIAGNGVSNTLTTTPTSGTATTSLSQPKNLMIWGTGDSTQTIKVAGNGQLSAVVYAPNAALEAKGGGTTDGGLFGAFVGKTVKMTGNEGFHYDESLANLDSGEPLGIDKWDEFVSTADRSTLGTLMDF
jgi:hypothetical protein